MAKRNAPISVPLGLGARIRAARESAGLSQAELARSVGVSKSAVSQWENGAVQNLKLGNLFATAQALHRDVRDLVFGDARGSVAAERAAPYSEIAPDRLVLIRTYGKLPKDVRAHLRGLITLLAEKYDVS